jgi:16S rRNA (cytidine1402-2'-O)-methyltransferase
MPLAVCATPIGNLEDITLRVLAELREAELVLAEDTRHTRGLLERHGIKARLLSYHEHNEAARVAELLPRLEAGERIALVSDAGMPAISDPGARLVRAALDAGIDVTVLPGPSAVETALVASGLAGGRYAFVGFEAVS